MNWNVLRIIPLLCLCTVLVVQAQDNVVEALLDQMTLEQKVAQMFLISLFSDSPTLSERDLLRTWQPGGVVLLEKNVGNPAQTTRLTNELQRIVLESGGLPLFIAIDQEGGPIAHLRDGFTEWPAPMLLTATADEGLAYAVGMAQARELRAVGVNMNLAPVADLGTNPLNTVIGRRAYGRLPAQVSPIISSLIRGLQDGGVLATTKHFPGHGDTASDSHLELPILPHSRDDLEKRELIPFIAAIQADSGAIMVAHIAFPELEPIDDKRPASLSQTIVDGLLRQELGYDGLIITDALDMDAIDTTYSASQAAVMAIQAGNDLIIIGAHAGPEIQARAMQAVIKAVQDGNIDEARLNESVRRILKAKNRLGLLDEWTPLDPASADARLGKEEHAQLVADLFRKGITVIHDTFNYIPTPNNVPTLLIYPATQPSIREICRQTGINTSYLGISATPTEEDIARAQTASQGKDIIFIFTLNANMSPSQQTLITTLQPQKVVVISLWSADKSVFSLNIAGYVVTYSPISPAVETVCDILAGNLPALGRRVD